MKAEKTQSSDVKNIHKDIYQSEIADEQQLEEKAETFNE